MSLGTSWSSGCRRKKRAGEKSAWCSTVSVTLVGLCRFDYQSHLLITDENVKKNKNKRLKLVFGY